LLKNTKFVFGDRLRKIRELKKITLKGLAERIGVSESLISQIERNKVSPSIDTLLALAEELEVDLDFLFRDYKRPRKATIIKEQGRNRLYREGVAYEQLSVLADREEQHALEAVMLIIEPGKEKGSKDFGHEGRELGILLDGEGRLFYGDAEYPIEAGDSVSFAADIPHVLKNTGNRPLRAIWIINPPKRDYFTE